MAMNDINSETADAERRRLKLTWAQYYVLKHPKPKSERKQFEAWWMKNHATGSDREKMKRDRDGLYRCLLARWAWVGWMKRAGR